jgi:hypothetical protein
VLGVVLNGGVGRRSDYAYARRPLFLPEAHEGAPSEDEDADEREVREHVSQRSRARNTA